MNGRQHPQRNAAQECRSSTLKPSTKPPNLLSCSDLVIVGLAGDALGQRMKWWCTKSPRSPRLGQLVGPMNGSRA
ncbi:hypothetical protein NDU88_000267 [Pleurodeles waltl]|uniref:Uncharacterized protein n=1 Tax=Pleurodeles waltl TaxID=8319 RepID=A0AAV7V6G7_PLEWA|nr:hypothetical protein NDU88_000267 [Pleurodeles waltl]